MYSKDEKKKQTVDFWNSFGLYMKKHNKDFGKIRWVNYRTNVKDIYVRLNITNKNATFAIELQHKDDGIRELIFEQFKALKKPISTNVDGNLLWNDVGFNDTNQPISSITETLNNVSIYNKEDWQQVFFFFEKRIIGFHTFWIEFSELFKELE